MTEYNTSGLVFHNWNSRRIRIRPGDRFVCLTDMAQATGKRFPDWNRLQASQEFLAELSAVVQIPTSDLIQTTQGGQPQEQGTASFTETEPMTL